MATDQKINFFANDTVHSAVLTPYGSKTFIKKLIPVSIAFILHQRTDFSRNNFNTHSHNGVLYKAFKTKVHNQCLKEVRSWIKGVLDAFEKNYLRELYLIFCCHEDPHVVLESYKFQFKYMGNDVIPLYAPATKEELAVSTNNLLKGIESLDQHTQLKEGEFTLKMTLSYYEDVTPLTYEPPFFNTDDITTKIIMENVSTHSNNYFLLGALSTGFHIVKCRAKGDMFSMNNTTSTNLDNETTVDMELEENNEENCNKMIDTMLEKEKQMEIEDIPIVIPELPEPESTLLSGRCTSLDDTDIISLNSSRDDEDCRIQCICEIPTTFDYIAIVQCTKCSYKQHVTCVDKCCYKNDLYTCQFCFYDDILTPNESRNKQQIAAYRLAVLFAYFNKKFPGDVLDKLSKETRNIILNKFTKYGMVFEDNGKYIINLQIIEQAYFQIKRNMNLPQEHS